MTLRSLAELGSRNNIFTVEKEMGYRGSKSIVSSYTVVKEQRVDGNWPVLLRRNTGLRYTLKGFEKNRAVLLYSNYSIINKTLIKKIF